MSEVRSFAPIARKDATLLILGTVPSIASLAAGRPYAHPQNAYWRIMAELVGVDPASSYEQRFRAIKKARIAMWDVLESCTRTGSLDSNIRDEVPNDFATFFRTHRQIRRVILNGGKAWSCYRSLVLARGIGTEIEYLKLPSTSPANASWTYARKLAAWRAAILDRTP